MIGLLLFLFCKIHSLRKNCEKSVISKQLMMKKRLLSVALLMGAWGTYGQVGIGTLTPDNSSQLDVVANDKGILIPRISLTSTTDATTIKNGNVNSLLVFNTNTQNDITPGYYYWYVDKWMRIINHDDVTALDANTTNVSLTVVGDELVLTDSEDNVVSIPLSEINIPTTVVKNPDGTYTYTNEAGDTVTIDATDNVISNFENIVNNTNVLNELIEVLGDTYVGGNVYYDGTQFTYVDQAGDTHIVDIQDIVQANETVTTIVKNTDGTYTYTNEAGDTVTIDATDNVISNFENIVNNTNALTTLIRLLGDTYVGGNVYYDGTQFTYIDQAGDTHIVNIQDIVQANETVTTIVKNTDGTYTYTNEAGDTVTIDATDNVISNFENIVNNTNVLNELIEVLGDTYVGGNVYYDGTQFTYVDQAGDTHIVDIQDIVQANETVTTVVKNPDGTYTYTNEAGDTVTIDATDNVISNFENIVNNTNVLNELIEVLGDTYVGGNVYYDGTQFTYVDQAGDTHIVDIQDIVQANETVTTIVKNTDGTYTYTNEAGDTVTIDATDNVISNFENIVDKKNVVNELIEVLGDTYVGGNVYYDGTQFTYIDQAGDTHIVNIQDIVQANETVTTIVKNTDGTYTYTNEAGDTVTIDATDNVISNFENIVNNTNVLNELIEVLGDTYVGGNVYYDGTQFTYIDQAGDTNTINLQEIITNEVVNNIVNQGDIYDEIINILEQESDVLIDNNDGTYTHTAVDGSVVTIDANTTTVEVADGVYTFKDGAGNTITTIDTNADAIAYNNDNSGLTAENVQDAIDELTDKLAEGAGVELKDEGDGKITLIADNGDILGTVDKAALTEDLNNDGLFTFTRNDGQDVVFDVNSVNVSEKLDADGNVIGYDFNDANGNPITTVLTDATNNYYNNDNSGLTAENVQDAIDELADKLAEGAGVELKDEGDGKITLIADNGDILGTVDKAALTEDLNNDGLFTFTRNDGQDVVFDVNSVNVSEKLDADGNVIGYDFNDAAGNPITTVFTDATNNYYNNDNSGLTAENVQDAIDELADKLAEGAGGELKDEGDGKITLIADNGDILGTVDKATLTEDLTIDGVLTMSRNDGQDVVFDVNSVNVSEKLDADGNVIGYDFNDAAGNPITTVFTDATNNYYNNDNSGLTAENVQDAIDELADKLAEGAGVELKDEGDGKITLIADNGDILGTVDKAALTEDLNNDGLFTFTRNDGQDVVFDVNSVNVSEKLDADGNVIGYDFNDANGNPITTVFTDATNNYYNNDNSGLTAENVQDAIDELADKLAEGAGVELKDEGDGKITLIADNGDILGTVDKAALTEDLNNDGLFTFTRNDGQDVVFDVNS